MKTNYIIASWNGPRISTIKNPSYYTTVLNNHLKQLGKLKHSIDEVTIMKPNSPHKNAYYNIDTDIGVKVSVIECENQFQSYGQWLKAIEMNLDRFDYFILVEDDYVPTLDNFDEKLINIYDEGSFLCSMISEKHILHCGISNGIISKKTIEPLIKSTDFRDWFINYDKANSFSFGGSNFQIVFSRYFADNNITLKDYLNHYGSDFHYKGIMIDYTKNNEPKILTPIQNIY